MKFFKVLILVAILLVTGCFVSYAKNDIKLFVDGNQVVDDVAPAVVNNRILVPVRSVFEELGAEVTWIGSRKQVIIRTVTTRIVFNLGKSKVYVDDKGYNLDVAATAIDGRTMIPVRFVSEKLGYEVQWSQENNSVHINTPKSRIQGPIIEKIKVNEGRKNTKVYITLDDMKKPEISYATNPMRFIADFSNGFLENGDSSISVNNKDISQVRFAQHPDYARVVIEAPSDAEFSVKYNSGSMVITVEGMEIEEEIPPAQVTTPVYNNKEPHIDYQDKNDISSGTVNNIPSVPAGEPVIVLDAGHGGSDAGAVAEDENGNVILKESHANLAITMAVQKYLEAEGVNVVLTRSADVDMGADENAALGARCSIANTINATYFVSIHNNSFFNGEATGTEILYIDSDYVNEYGVSSKQLAQNILDPLCKATGLYNRGLKHSPTIYVLKYTNMPAVLIECAFVSNENDRKILMDQAKIDKMGYAIASGIIKTLGDF